MNAAPRAALANALARNDLDTASEVLLTCAKAAASRWVKSTDAEVKLEDAFNQYVFGDLLTAKKYADFRDALAALLAKCPTDAALSSFLGEALRLTMRRQQYHAGPNKDKRRRLREQVRAVAEESSVFQCETHQSWWPVGLAGWPASDVKGSLRTTRRTDDDTGWPEDAWPADRPGELPPQPDTPKGSRTPPYPPEALAARMGWTLAHHDRYIEGALLSRWIWMVFCGADAVSVTSADRDRGGGKDAEPPLSDRLAAADDADTRVWEYEDAAALFAAGLPSDRMRAVWNDFVIPEAMGEKIGLVAMGERLGVSHATVDNDAKAVTARLREFVRARDFRPVEVSLFLRAARVLAAAAAREG